MKHWILFDLDGTLTDPMIGITSAVKYALSKYGIDVPYLKELIPFIGPPLKDSFMEFYDFSESQAEEAISYYREYYGPKGLFENEVYPGIKDLLVHLEAAGFELAVATSKPTDFSVEILKHFGLMEHFSLVVGSEFDGRRTDKAEVIREVIKRGRISSREALMVGDRSHDIIGAIRCDIDSIGVAYGYGGREELEQAGATYVVDSIKDLEQKIFAILEEEHRNDRRFMSWNRNQTQEAESIFAGKPVRLGIVGMNQCAEKFYQANRFGRNLEMLAACGNHMEEVEAFVFRKGNMACTDKVQELAECEWLDAAFVCSDRRSRFSDCLTLLKAGKHVLCQPPMAESSQQIRELYDAAEENQVILMEGIPTIHTPAFEKMIPYMDSLGKIRHATFHNCHYNAAYEQKKCGLMSPEFNPELNGGALMELGVYPVAFMIRLFGSPKAVHAAGVNLSNGMNITGTILMEYQDMIGEAIYSKVSDSSMPSQIQGEEGSMLIREIDNIKDLRISRRKVDQAIHFEQSDNIYNYETNAFVQMIQTGMGMDKSKEISVETMKVLEEASKQMGLRREDQE